MTYFKIKLFAFTSVLMFFSALCYSTETLSDFKDYKISSNSIDITTVTGQTLRLRAYGDKIIRVQAIRNGETFFDDNHYEMVEKQDWQGTLTVVELKNILEIKTNISTGITVRISKSPLRLTFYVIAPLPVLKDDKGISWEEHSIYQNFLYQKGEHFSGMGHGYKGEVKSIDLVGQIIERNYGSEHGSQAPLIVPFYLSDKGYGIFLNSTCQNRFNFGKDRSYCFSIENDSNNARMDYYFIQGPLFRDILNEYTQLTGRPRLPRLAFFGLALSDKSEEAYNPSDETWWKLKFAANRKAGYPLDHIIIDNRWRAGKGTRCDSRFEWSTDRFPNPAEFHHWLDSSSLVMTLDFNRCIAVKCEGWDSTFSIPMSDKVEFGESTPDFTRFEVRQWWWHLMWNKTVNPALSYPNNALWIDEFDEMGQIPLNVKLGNGLMWSEMKNYWFFLIAKALVQEGWDKDMGDQQRPYVWVRGMTAGAQRYATLWSGDINTSYKHMKNQVRAMQTAGLSGFPFWGHDAGGFANYDNFYGRDTPDDSLYIQWAMAFGSFAPIWKPHGMGYSRWPLDRPKVVQDIARKFCTLRYMLTPYNYTCAYQAYATGTPMARAMIIDYQEIAKAWKHDLQYMWGDNIIVAPNTSVGNNYVKVWLPAGKWFDFNSGSIISGNKDINYYAATGVLPLFIKQGSIIPMYPYALSTALIPKDSLILHVYTGDKGEYELYEDDGITEYYKTRGEYMLTLIKYNDVGKILVIGGSRGYYEKAPNRRSYQIIFHLTGINIPTGITLNGTTLKVSIGTIASKDNHVVYDPVKNIFQIQTADFAIKDKVEIRLLF